MENPSEYSVNMELPIEVTPELLRHLNYNYNTLYSKIESTEFMCPELRRLLTHCNYLQETTNESLSDPSSPKPVMHTLFLLEDALDRKLTLEEYNERRKILLGNGTPSLVKLGLLMLAIGSVLAAAGLFLTYGMSVAAPVAGSKLLIFGGAFALDSPYWFFRSRPEKISRLADDLGPVLYNAMSASPR